MSIQDICKRLRKFSSKEKSALLQRFFKTGPGDYGEGDIFLGVMVPNIRLVAKEFRDAPDADVLKLLRSPFHEERLLALLILVGQYEKGDDALKKKIYGLYLKNTRYINNWDLVDLSAPKIVGAHLIERSRRPLYALAKSRDLWKRRIAILSTSAFIRQGDFRDTLAISRILMNDGHDLIHKAVGWMLREVGKRDVSVLEQFLKDRCLKMPRTMLRYAIERFPEAKRRKYLNRTS